MSFDTLDTNKSFQENLLVELDYYIILKTKLIELEI